VDRRILLLLTDLEIGGTPTVVRELAARLHRPPELCIHVACLDRWGPAADLIAQKGISVTALNAKGKADLWVIGRLVKLIRAQRCDTVLSFLVHANAAAAVAGRYCRGVRFLQSIQTTQRRPHWHWRLQRLAQRAAEKIVVPSASAAAVAAQWAGVAPEKIVVIPNAVDAPDRLPPSPPACRPHRVIFLGRLDPIKRLPDLLQAVALLDGLVHLDIFGQGREKPALQKQIEQLQLTRLAELRGAISGPAQALQGAELLVLPSEAEGFGLVLIEAMSAGVPVVATDAPGIRDVVQSGVTGLLAPVGDPPALAAAIRRVLEDENLRQAMVAAAWADVRQRFGWEAVLAAYRRLFQI
jgi:glycosyltransferase involved in cell wall biosynthesis